MYVRIAEGKLYFFFNNMRIFIMAGGNDLVNLTRKRL